MILKKTLGLLSLPSPISEGRVLCTRLHLEFFLTSFESILILIPPLAAFFFLFWNAVWGKSTGRGKAGSQPEGFVIGSGFSVVGSQRQGEGRKRCHGFEPIS